MHHKPDCRCHLQVAYQSRRSVHSTKPAQERRNKRPPPGNCNRLHHKKNCQCHLPQHLRQDLGHQTSRPRPILNAVELQSTVVWANWHRMWFPGWQHVVHKPSQYEVEFLGSARSFDVVKEVVQWEDGLRRGYLAPTAHALRKYEKEFADAVEQAQAWVLFRVAGWTRWLVNKETYFVPPDMNPDDAPDNKWACSPAELLIDNVPTELTLVTPQGGGAGPRKSGGKAARKRQAKTVQPVQPVQRVDEEVWIQCDNTKCRKWRRIRQNDAPEEGQHWQCSHNQDDRFSRCSAAQEMSDAAIDAR